MNKVILEITQPGVILNHEIDEGKNYEINSIVRHLIDSFYEAHTSLHLFEDEYKNSSYMREYLRSKFALNIELNDNLEKEIGQEMDDPSFQKEVRLKRIMWKNGFQPLTLHENQILLFARMYMFSLDNFHKLLIKLNHPEYNPPSDLGKILDKFNAIFANLTQIRNSAHHLEDRIRRKKTHEKDINLKPIDQDFIIGTALVLNNLNDNKYGFTMADGSFGEVEVSMEKLIEVRSLLQEIIDLYEWSSVKIHLPQ